MDASTMGNWPPGSLGACNCAGMTPCYIRIQLPGTWLKKKMCPDCRSPRRISSRWRPCLFQPALSRQAMDALASGWMQWAMQSPFPLTYRGGAGRIHPILPLPHSLLGQPPDATAPTVSGRMYYIAQNGIKAKGHCLDSKVLPSVPIIQAIPFAGDMPSS